MSKRWHQRQAGRRLADAAVIAACLVLTALAVKAHWSPLPSLAIAVAGTAGTLAQCWRRRWPALAAVAGVAAYALSGNPGPLLLGLYAGVVYAPRRQLWIAAVAGGAADAAWSWVDGGRLTWSDAEAAAGIAVLVAACGQYVSSRRRKAELARADEQRRNDSARAAERAGIAREMHDVLAHKLSLIAVHAGALELAVAGQGEQLEHGAGLIRVTARQGLQELRYVLGVLRDDAAFAVPGPAPDSGEPFADLQALVTASQQSGQHIELADVAGPLPSATARVVYRIAQEGLTNARKHAPDAPVTIRVQRAGSGTVRVTVENPAASAPPLGLPGSGTGLIGLAERVRLAGGVLDSGPRGAEESGGWRLSAVVPWLDHDADPDSTAAPNVAAGAQ